MRKKTLSLMLALAMLMTITIFTTSIASAKSYAPAQMTSFYGVEKTTSSVVLKWKKQSDVTGYILYKKINGHYERIKVYHDNDYSQYTDTNCTTNEVAYYKIKAYTKVNGKNYYGKASDSIRVLPRSTKYSNVRTFTFDAKDSTIDVGERSGMTNIEAKTFQCTDGTRSNKVYSTKLKWYTSDKSIVAVSQKGSYRGVSPGTATICAITHNGRIYSQKITVKSTSNNSSSNNSSSNNSSNSSSSITIYSNESSSYQKKRLDYIVQQMKSGNYKEKEGEFLVDISAYPIYVEEDADEFDAMAADIKPFEKNHPEYYNDIYSKTKGLTTASGSAHVQVPLYAELYVDNCNDTEYPGYVVCNGINFVDSLCNFNSYTSGTYFDRKEKLQDALTKFNNEYDSSVGNASDIDKLHFIDNYVCENIVYGDDASNTGTIMNPLWITLVGHKGVCQDYAETFGVLARSKGFEVMYPNTSNHIWNSVYYNGQWLNIDSTWNDIGSSSSSKYFLLTDSETEKTHGSFSK